MNDKFDPGKVELEPFQQAYSEQDFWDKVSNYFHNIGKEALIKALTLYYTAKDVLTPDWVRVLVYSALGYFISPIDVIPDFIPLLGYSDDLAILATILFSIKAYVGNQHRDAAEVNYHSLINTRFETD
jgi:uncharacterized membrane protein YkvA (DUF1232 family)